MGHWAGHWAVHWGPHEAPKAPQDPLGGILGTKVKKSRCFLDVFATLRVRFLRCSRFHDFFSKVSSRMSASSAQVSWMCKNHIFIGSKHTSPAMCAAQQTTKFRSTFLSEGGAHRNPAQNCLGVGLAVLCVSHSNAVSYFVWLCFWGFWGFPPPRRRQNSTFGLVRIFVPWVCMCRGTLHKRSRSPFAC